MVEELVVNPNTVGRAYTDLAHEGLIESRGGRGMFITRKRKMVTREEGGRGLGPLLAGLLREAMVLDFTLPELREAFEKKLSQCQWNFAKGGNRNNEWLRRSSASASGTLRKEATVTMNEQPVI